MNNRVRSEVIYDGQYDGQVASVALARPTANILDRATMHEFIDALKEIKSRECLKAVVITGDGPHFSFGASIEEHLPSKIEETLSVLHALLEELATVPAPTIAAVRGQCLGGGFEVALACDLIVAEEGAQLGLPEVKLGVFPPAGAALLPARIGVSRSAELILTGNSWTAAAGLAAGIVHKVAPHGELDLQVDNWLKKDFLPRSAAALRYAAQAIRRPILAALQVGLAELETIYLNQLMGHPDATEGIQAFLEKRQPHWVAMAR